MADAQQLLAEALAMLDSASTLEHYEVNKALEPAGKAAKESARSRRTAGRVHRRVPGSLR